MRVKNTQHVCWIAFEWHGGAESNKVDNILNGTVCTVEFVNNLKYWYVAKAKLYYGEKYVSVKEMFFYN
jgi:spore coat polysaccharide biosynthesis predicted glycosyltransferase SpsG